MSDSRCSTGNCGTKKEKETEVSCSATECVHNESEKCMADHIKISGTHASTSRETECDTFRC